MKSVLITGANGLVGSALARHLVAEGCHVRGLVRPTSDLQNIADLPVERVYGDVRDPSSLSSALVGVDTVFHTAALVSYWRKERDTMFDVNIGGTHNIVEASITARVERFIHTSSIAALPLRSPGPVTSEDTPHDGEFLDVGYRIAKYRSEQVVLDAVGRGLPAVILNPAIIMGPGDRQFHGGRMIKDIYTRKIFYASPGGSNIVHVDDVATAHIAAASVGRIGERYILSGENLSFKEIFTIVADVTGGIRPQFTIPAWMVQTIASITDGLSSVTGSKPWVSRELVAGIRIRKQYSSDKARRELGFAPRSTQEAIEHTFAWYKEMGLL